MLGGNYLYGITPTELVIPVPASPTGNPITDILNSGTYFVSSIWSFFNLFFILSLSNETVWWLGFINWAMLGTLIYLFIKVIRGTG